MKLKALLLATAALGAASSISCSGEACRSQRDCPVGSHCVLSVSGGQASGVCESECIISEDCGENRPDDLVLNVCDEEGYCILRQRSPEVRVLNPENDSLLEEGTRKVSLSGVISTGATAVTVTVIPRGGSCSRPRAQSVTIENPSAGRWSEIPFLLTDVDIDPGLTTLEIQATIDGAREVLVHYVEVPCPGCAEIQLSQPEAESVGTLYIPRLEGSIEPASIRTAIWRVRNDAGDVFDGRLTVTDGRFSIDRVPLFAGPNRLEVVASGAGEGSAENRCSRSISSAIPSEDGFRGLLTWDGDTSDLDLHVVGPGGQFGDSQTSLSSTSPFPEFGGQLHDDFDGLGPEVATVESMADGVYGVVVIPVFDDQEPGSSAFMRVLYDGRLLVRGALGPQYLSTFLDELWVVGRLHVTGGSAVWETLDELVPLSNPPTNPPELWPDYYRQ